MSISSAIDLVVSYIGLFLGVTPGKSIDIDNSREFVLSAEVNSFDNINDAAALGMPIAPFDNIDESRKSTTISSHHFPSPDAPSPYFSSF
jgi:hypothetical protein